jgi:Asp-tRNA(Asn)/Glu-tRNA(Gln) amidotransferase A subunit family amidase
MGGETSSLDILHTITKLRRGEVDLLKYVGSFCDRIEAEDPKIHALVPGTFDRARCLKQASKLLEQYPDPEARPPLFGVPVGVKDIFRVAGFPTRAGSKLPAELFAGEEATCVSRLKGAGAIIMGKTETTEFAWMEPGPTRNPHNLEHTPGGSSSGSAAGVAAGFFPFALGTQTAGSIIRPAAYCGIVGFKPTFGRIPVSGVIPFSPSADQVGFFCEDPSGVGIFASILAEDWQSPFESHQERQPVLGVPEGPYLAQAAENAREHFERGLTMLIGAGYPIKRIDCLSDIEMVNQCHRRMIAAEMARVHSVWFKSYTHLYRKRTVETIEQGLAIADDELERLRSGRLPFREELEQLTRSEKIDCWICPSTTDHAPPGLESTGSPTMNIPWTYAGLPTISLPAGMDSSGLPLGIQVVGRYRKDEDLVVAAEGIFPIISAG